MAPDVGGEFGAGARLTPISPHIEIYSYQGGSQTNIR
jgi:hypothetical protein